MVKMEMKAFIGNIASKTDSFTACKSSKQGHTVHKTARKNNNKKGEEKADRQTENKRREEERNP